MHKLSPVAIFLLSLAGVATVVLVVLAATGTFTSSDSPGTNKNTNSVQPVNPVKSNENGNGTSVVSRSAVPLNDSNYHSTISKEPEAFVMLYKTQGCSRSDAAYPGFMAAAEESRIQYFTYPYSSEPAHILDEYGIQDFPHFYHYKLGQYQGEYMGNWSKQDFLNFTG